jgi:hypothetical protein
MTKFRAELSDCDTRVRRGGSEEFERARAAAIEYLEQRLAGAGTANPARLARLRLALLRLSSPAYRGD